MTTTFNAHTLGEFTRVLSTSLFLLVGITSSQAQGHPRNGGNSLDFKKEEVAVFAYTFQIAGVTDRASAKDFSEAARGLFDGVPEFDEKTTWFTCYTTYALDGEDVSLKIEWMGYELKQFKSIETRE